MNEKQSTPTGSVKQATKHVAIAPPNFREGRFTLRGTAPLVIHRFSEKARGIMKDGQVAGSKAKNRTAKAPKDFAKLYEAAKHISTDGWCGVPAAAFRSSLISACRVAGFAMTKAKLSVFAEADGIGEDGTPLVKIVKGEPEPYEAIVRLQGTTTDIRVRPMWREWEVKLILTWDADQFGLEDITNLLYRAGVQVGVGEGRPDSKTSSGMGWGRFTLVDEEA